MLVYHKWDIRHDIYPARGRKRFKDCLILISMSINSPRYLPRKGTETTLLTKAVKASITFLFATIFTPQGDGNVLGHIRLYIDHVATIRHDIYPARGRKQHEMMKVRSLALKYSPRYLPRKGTETRTQSFC